MPNRNTIFSADAAARAQGTEGILLSVRVVRRGRTQTGNPMSQAHSAHSASRNERTAHGVHVVCLLRELAPRRLGGESNPSPVFQGDGFQDRSARQLQSEPKRQAREPIVLDLVVVCRRRSPTTPRVARARVESAERRAADWLLRYARSGLTLSRGDVRVVLMGELLRGAAQA